MSKIAGHREGMVWVGGYLPEQEVAVLDAYVKSMQGTAPHLRATRTGALRRLFLLGLRSEGQLPAELQSILPAEKVSGT